MKEELSTESKTNKYGDKVIRTLFCITLALTVITASFFAGFFVREQTMSKELRTLNWVISTIKKEYYEDFTSTEIIDAATMGLETLLDRYSTYYTEEEYRAVLGIDNPIHFSNISQELEKNNFRFR